MAGEPGNACPIEGIVLHPLTPHHDERGRLVEVYRESWDLGCRSVQFNAVTSASGVMRGVHAHVRHVDHLFVADGCMTLGLHDIRPWSATAGRSWQVVLDAAVPLVAVVPQGIAHGFYFTKPSVLLYGVSHYWDTADEIACRWDCRELGIAWPASTAILSERDKEAPDYGAFVDEFLKAWSAAYGTPNSRSGE